MISQKYDLKAISKAWQPAPHFLSKSRNGNLVMRRDEIGNFKLLADDQKTIVDVSREDAIDFALWILSFERR